MFEARDHFVLRTLNSYLGTSVLKKKSQNRNNNNNKKKLIRKNYNHEDSVSNFINNFSVSRYSTFKSTEDYKNSEESNRR